MARPPLQAAAPRSAPVPAVSVLGFGCSTLAGVGLVLVLLTGMMTRSPDAVFWTLVALAHSGLLLGAVGAATDRGRAFRWMPLTMGAVVSSLTWWLGVARSFAA